MERSGEEEIKIGQQRFSGYKHINAPMIYGFRDLPVFALLAAAVVGR